MGHQVIQQPDGKYAIWSTVVDDWIIFDADRNDVITYYVEEEVERVRERTSKIMDAMESGNARDIYRQFTMTFEEAQERRRDTHGEAPWPPPLDEEPLGIIGREQKLIEGLTKVIYKAAQKKGNYTPVYVTYRGSWFEVQFTDEDDKPTGHVAKVTVQLDRFEEQDGSQASE